MSKDIFIVEDDADYFKFIKASLKEKYNISSFINAEDCLEALLKPNKPDILIIDHFLPGMNGMNLFEKVKNTLPKTCKVIILSSMDNEKILFDYFKKGIRYYVIKDENVIESLIESIEEE